ncbi:MAG: response regulator [Deltaproteobacteria bacterium]|nr:response regulator [Deltaproteobacteria bacterium]
MSLKILLVDDDADDRRALATFFTHDAAFAVYRVRVLEAADGDEALRVLDREQPDLVVTDLAMPGVDGFALCQAIRQRPEGAALPLLVTTGVHRDEGMAVKLRESFGVEVLTKPVPLRYLAGKVLALLRRRQRDTPDIGRRWLKGTSPVSVLATPAVAAGEPEVAVQLTPSPPLATPARATDGGGTSAAPIEVSFRAKADGTLEATSVAWLLVQAADRRATGTLRLARGKVRKVVFILQGRPIYVDSNLRNETLGAHLMQQGVLTEADLARAMKQARTSGKKLGEVLTALGLATAEVVAAGLQAQTGIKLVSALRWPDGTFSFEPGDDFSSRVPSCPVEVVPLVLTALRRLLRPEELGRLSLEQALALTPAGERLRPLIEQHYGATVLGWCGTSRALRELAAGAEDLPPLLVRVEALRLAGLVVFRPPVPIAAPVAAPTERATGAADSSGSKLEFVEEDLGGVSRLLDLKQLDPTRSAPSVPAVDLELFEPSAEEPQPPEVHARTDDSGVLHLANVDDLELEQPEAEATALLGASAATGPLEPTPSEEFPEVPAAQPTVLQKPRRAGGRAAAPAEEARRASGPVAPLGELKELFAGLSPESYHEWLGLGPGATAQEVQAALRRLGLDGEAVDLAGLTLGELTPELAPTDPAARVIPDRLQGRSHDEFLSRARPQLTPKADTFGAELFFQHGQSRLRTHDLVGAVEAFRQAVEHNAEQADYHAYLGWALFLQRGKGEAGAIAARPHLQHALHIAPDSPQVLELAGLLEREVRNDDAAAPLLLEALRHYPTRAELFAAAKDVLARLGDFAALERLYRRLIFQLRDTEPLRTVPLWIDLAYLYRDKLAQPENARLALEVAAKLNPEDVRVHAARASMDEAARVDLREAAEGLRQRFLAHPEVPDPLHELYRLHLAAGHTDRLLAVAGILVERGHATPEEYEVYQARKPVRLRRARAPLSANLLDRLRDPSDSRSIEQIVALLSPMLCERFPLSATELGCRSDDLLDPQRLPEPFGATVRYVAKALELPLPRLYLSAYLPLMVPVPDAQPQVLVSPEVLSSSSEEAIAFAAARAFSSLDLGRRHAFTRRGTDLKAAFLGALTYCRPELQVPDADGTIGRLREVMDSGLVDLASLRSRIDDLTARKEPINLSEWMRGVRRTGARVGLLVCTDVPAAVAGAGDTGTQRDLEVFALGETYHQLQQTLGLSLETS